MGLWSTVIATAGLRALVIDTGMWLPDTLVNSFVHHIWEPWVIDTGKWVYLTWVSAPVQHVSRALSDWHRYVVTWPGSVPLCIMSPGPWVIDTSMWLPSLGHCPCAASLRGPEWLTQVCGWLPAPGSVPLCSMSPGPWVIDAGLWTPSLGHCPLWCLPPPPPLQYCVHVWQCHFEEKKFPMAVSSAFFSVYPPRGTDRLIDSRQTDRRTDRHTDRHADRQTV